VTSLAAGASTSGLPAQSTQGHTDFGSNQYGGPCPPPGAPHRYIVTVYALDVNPLAVQSGADVLEAGPDTTGALLRFMALSHTLAVGRAIGMYGR
jgi:phosphatidylethanolamine-binding protein (PEBP) family uncharacterized protein